MTIATPRAPWPYTERAVEVVPGVPKDAPREERFLWTDVCSDCRTPQGEPHKPSCRMGFLAPSEEWHGGPRWTVERDRVEARPYCQDCGHALRTDDGEWFEHDRDDASVECWVRRFLRPRDGFFMAEVHVGTRRAMADALRSVRRYRASDRRYAVRGLRWDPSEDVHAILVFASFEVADA